MLINANAHVNAKDSDGATALMYTAIKGHLGIARLLVDNKADVGIKDKSGITASMLATQTGHKDIAAFLNSINSNSIWYVE